MGDKYLNPQMLGRLAMMNRMGFNTENENTAGVAPVTGDQYGRDKTLNMRDWFNPNISDTDRQFLAGKAYVANPNNRFAQQRAQRFGVPLMSAPTPAATVEPPVSNSTPVGNSLVSRNIPGQSGQHGGINPGGIMYNDPKKKPIPL